MRRQSECHDGGGAARACGSRLLESAVIVKRNSFGTMGIQDELTLRNIKMWSERRQLKIPKKTLVGSAERRCIFCYLLANP